MADDGIFDAKVAATYDEVHGGGDPEIVVRCAEVLKDLAFDDTALEFAIGTGRIGLPLFEMGVDVKAIELSAAMVDELKKKKNGEQIEVAIGDMTTTRVDGAFSLVFLVFNTIDNLTSQDAQVACFQNASDHLKSGGRFAIETLVPPIQKIPFGETKLAFACSEDHMGVDEFDVVSQNYSSNHMRMEDGSARFLSVPFRYAWPSEMDLMAKMAGMELEHRWSDWEKSQFTKTSKRHISVWRKSGS